MCVLCYFGLSPVPFHLIYTLCCTKTTEFIFLLFTLEHPIFYKEPSPRARLVGESITLCCSADGNPDVKYYEW